MLRPIKLAAWLLLSASIPSPVLAQEPLEATMTFGGRTSIYLAALGHAYAVAGLRDQAREVLEELQTRAKSRYTSALDTATVYLGLGDTNGTFEWLERVFQTRASALVYLAVDPRYDRVRGDPRFVDLLRRIGLPTNVSFGGVGR